MRLRAERHFGRRRLEMMMSREIKFRAWDREDKEWNYFDIEGLLSAIYYGDTSALNVTHVKAFEKDGEEN